MASAKAIAKFVRVAPRKARLVADLVRGKKVSEARAMLEFTQKGAAPLVGKLLASAVANAESVAAERDERIDSDEMIISDIQVQDGPTMRRFQPSARGRAGRIRKRSSHISMEISE